MRRLIFALLLTLSSAAAAANATELENLYSALNMLNQQQQAVYQHFQMVQEVRRAHMPPPLYSTPVPAPVNGQIANYDTVVAAQKNARLREENLARQADQLLTRYNEIEEMKKPLQSRIYELTLKTGND